MSKNDPPSARDLYLASLSPELELAARRVAEKSGVPDDDPTWLLLSEVQRACREANQCTDKLTLAVSDAASRIERAGTTDSGSSENDDAMPARIASSVGVNLSENERIIDAVANAIHRVERDAIRTIRTLETSIRDFARRRSSAPITSLVFAFALGIASGCFSIWETYHVALGYGQDLGYRVGYSDARIYDRSHR